ncbi:MAG: hypothetical protein DHS20C05_09480 [Hyphococcus sp.]|nr:MAG: hypothetical protein DHS20C05_09480 [Marinicaulis sp.]
MINRRHILTVGGASIALVGCGIIAGRALHSDLSAAQRPWKTLGQDLGDPRLNALAYAILAPNPHNRQPWLVDLGEPGALTLYADLDRLLPETDPPNRQIVIGLGAFLEALRQAAAQQSLRLETTPFPEGEPHPTLDERPVAHVRFIADESVEADPLFEAIPHRRTARIPFQQDRPVNADTLKQLDTVLRETDGYFEWVNDVENITSIKEICKQGWTIEATTPHTHHESTNLMRFGEKQINENPDGISLSGPFMEATRLAGVMTQEKMEDPNSIAFKGGLDFYNGLIDSAMAFGWLSTDGNTRIDQLNVGAGWLRLHLAATQAGLAMHPLSQVLQEFPEMTELYEDFHDFADIRQPARVQGLFRFGYAKAPAPSPRWPLETRILSA